jgi:hypothetical protein
MSLLSSYNPDSATFITSLWQTGLSITPDLIGPMPVIYPGTATNFAQNTINSEIQIKQDGKYKVTCISHIKASFVLTAGEIGAIRFYTGPTKQWAIEKQYAPASFVENTLPLIPDYNKSADTDIYTPPVANANSGFSFRGKLSTSFIVNLNKNDLIYFQSQLSFGATGSITMDGFITVEQIG